jgi:hypothetical protein
MSEPISPAPVLYVLGVLYRDRAAWLGVRAEVEALLGTIGEETAPIPFPFTDYYDAEMGGAPTRVYAWAGGPRTPEDLPRVKQATNAIEARTRSASGRTLNLDPGYVDEHHLILATGKPHAARPYLAHGLYAYIALVSGKGGFAPLPWTFPDYREPATIAFFDRVRARLFAARRETLPEEIR